MSHNMIHAAHELCSTNDYVPQRHAGISERMPESSQSWVMPHKWSDLIKVCSLKCELLSMVCSVVSASF